MKCVEEIVEPYVEMERRVRELMTSFFSETCGLCTACCCRADICEEVADSAFLRLLLRKQDRAVSDMDDRYGWLDVNGCTLEVGRPPICYAYFCDEILARLPDEESRYLFRILGRLLDYVGEQALGDQHLTEIGNTDDLNRINLRALEKRLHQALAALDVIEELIEAECRLGPADRRVLSLIDLPE